MQLASDLPKIYLAVMTDESYKGCMAVAVAQDGEVIFHKNMPTWTQAKWTLDNWTLWECKAKYPKGFKKVDLSRMTMNELMNHSEFLSAMGIDDSSGRTE